MVDLLSYGISLVSMGITIFLAVRFVKYITYFSKFFFALVLAVAINPHITLVESSSFGNGAALFVILVVLCLLLGLFPRSNFALTYLLNFILIYAVTAICVDMLLPKLFEDFEMSGIIMVLVCAVGAFISFKVLLTQIEGGMDISFFPLRILDRIVGSVINSATFMLCVLLTIPFPDNNALFFIIMGVVAVILYVADLFLFSSITGMAHVSIPKTHFSILDMLSRGSVSAGFHPSDSYNDRPKGYFEPGNEDFIRDEENYHREEQERWAREAQDQREFDRWYKDNYGD